MNKWKHLECSYGETIGDINKDLTSSKRSVSLVRSAEMAHKKNSEGERSSPRAYLSFFYSAVFSRWAPSNWTPKRRFNKYLTMHVDNTIHRTLLHEWPAFNITGYTYRNNVQIYSGFDCEVRLLFPESDVFQ